MLLTKPLVIFDLETTGPDPENDRIVELGFIRLEVDEDRKDSKQVFRFNPTVPIPPEVARIHGIDDEEAKKHLTFAEQISWVMMIFKGADLAGYNVNNFDLPMLQAEFKRAGIDFPAKGTRVIDSYAIIKVQEHRTLEWALRYYCNRSIENAHTAMGDVEATYDVLRSQAGKYRAKSAEDLEGLGRDPTWVDDEGKIRKVEGGMILNFGKHKGTKLEEMDLDYLAWMLKADFSKQVKEVITQEIKRRQALRSTQ